LYRNSALIILLTQVGHTARFSHSGFFGLATVYSRFLSYIFSLIAPRKNNWDIFSHTPGKTYHNQTGDLADDSYNRYEEDIQLIHELGVSHYRFSISWSRIFPTLDSYTSGGSKIGIQYYNNVINELLKFNIQPFVTLFHWDLPEYLDWLKKDEIHPCGKIARIIDVYDALTANRPYAAAIRPFAALVEMKDGMLNCFDTELFKEFIRFLGPYDPRKKQRNNDKLYG